MVFSRTGIVAGALAMAMATMGQPAPSFSDGCYLTTMVITFDPGFQSFTSMTRPTSLTESPSSSIPPRSHTSTTSTDGSIGPEPTIESTLVSTTFSTMSTMSPVPQTTSSSGVPQSEGSSTLAPTNSGSTSPSAASLTSSSANMATTSDGPAPTLEAGDALYIAVNVATNTAKRAIFYIAFDSTGSSILVDTKALAAIFIIDSRGHLLSEGKYIGTSTTSGTATLQQFDEPPLNPLRIEEGGEISLSSATFCSTSNDAFFAVYDEDPIQGCSAVVIAAEPSPQVSTSASQTSESTLGASSRSFTQSPPTSSPVVSITMQQATSSSASNVAESSKSLSSSPSIPSPYTSSVSGSTTSRPTSTTPPSSSVRDTSSPVTSIITSPTTTIQTTSRIVNPSSPSDASIPTTNSAGTTSSVSISASSLSRSSEPRSSSSGSSAAASSTVSLTSSVATASSSAFTSSPTSTARPVTTTSIQSSLVSSSSTVSISSLTIMSSASTRSTSSTTTASPSTSSPTVQTTSTVTASSTFSSTSTTARPTSCVVGNRTIQIPPPKANRLPGKRGLAYNQVSTLRFYKPPTQVSWAYNYAGRPNNTNNVGPFPPSADLPLDFYPLLFNDKITLQTWFTNASDSIEQYGSDVLFSFNEPDFCIEGSSCMTVQQAIIAYEKFMQPFAACGIRLAAPSVTNAGQGLPWLQQFMGNATARNLTVDIINLHWYACAYCQAYFEEYFTEASKLFPNKPIWITEYGIGGKELQEYYSESDTNQFIKNTTWWAEKQPWIEKIAWFGNYPGKARLLKDDGSGLSLLGETWSTYVGTGYVGYVTPRLAAEGAERWDQRVQEESDEAFMPGNQDEAELRMPEEAEGEREAGAQDV